MIKRWTLKDANAKAFAEKVIINANWDSEEDPNAAQSQLKNCFLRVAKEILVESRGRNIVHRDTSWCNAKVKVVIKHKRDCYLAQGKCRFNENFVAYKDAKGKAKLVVRQSKEKAYQEVYERLDSKEGEKQIYKMVKRRQEERKTIDMVK